MIKHAGDVKPFFNSGLLIHGVIQMFYNQKKSIFNSLLIFKKSDDLKSMNSLILLRNTLIFQNSI